MPFELVCEDGLEQPGALGFVQPVEAERRPGRGAHLHHPGRASGLVLIGVGADQPVFCLFEEKSKRVERPGRAQPRELVRLELEGRLEIILVGLADAAVDAVGADDDVIAAQRGQIVDRAVIVDGDSHLFAALLEDLQQGQARATGESVSAAAHLAALVADDDIVPIGERIADHCEGRAVAAEELLQRFLREHDAEAESVVGAVLFMDIDLPIRTRLFCQKGQIKTAWTAAHDRDSERPFAHQFGTTAVVSISIFASRSTRPLTMMTDIVG